MNLLFLLGMESSPFATLYQIPDLSKNWWDIAEATMGVLVLVYFPTQYFLKRFFVPKKNLFEK